MSSESSSNTNESHEQKCGYIAVVGRPNVGKSTLLNYILGQKISITSRKPQTTRHTLLGIKTTDHIQAIYVDTPGIHKTEHHAMNRYMNRSAISVINDVDVIVMMVDRLQWTDADEWALEKIQQSLRSLPQGQQCPVVLAINKVDLINNKADILPYIEKMMEKGIFNDIIPLSALQKDQTEALENVLYQYLPEGQHYYEEDEITDKSERFLAAELIREKIIRQLGKELPYQVAVMIEAFKRESNVVHIHATILVERDSQKAIVIGKSGERLKSIGKEARLDMEQLFDQKVMLNLWVKVKKNWSDDERSLRSLGFTD